mgnify:FL=1
MYFSAHFDGRRNGLKDYDRGAVAALYGPSQGVPTPTRTPNPTPTIIPTSKPTPTPINTQTPTNTASPFYEVSSLLMSVSYTSVSIKLIIDSEQIDKTKPQLILYSNDNKKAVLLTTVSNVQTVKNQLTFRASPVPSKFITTNMSVAVITGKRIALVDLTCNLKSNNTYACQ